MQDINEFNKLALNKCKCCGDYYGAPSYKLIDQSKKFAKYGFGISLYFSLVCNLLFLSIMLLVK